jgi:acetyl esterase/lipase
MAELFPPDQPRPQPADFFDLAIAMLEADPHALDGMSASIPSTDQLVESFPELASVVHRDLDVAGPHGAVPARLYADPAAESPRRLRPRTPSPSGSLAVARPASPCGREPSARSEPSNAFVWVHGGAFIFGDLDILESHWVALSIAARGVPVVALDYRKALNGVSFPVPSDDVLAGWRHVADHADELFGVPAARVHLGGGSAGANLAVGVAKRLRDGGEALPASVVAAYGVFHPELPPFSDELLEAMERHPNPMEFPPELGRQMNLRFAGHEATLADPHAFPGNGDVSGLPPVYLLNSEADHLRASGELLGRQLDAAGVTVKVEFEPGTTHGHLNEAFDPAATRSVDRIVEWIAAPGT